ncbi:hypothetical protein GIB67_026660, partial [Kingdonia uniflora]
GDVYYFRVLVLTFLAFKIVDLFRIFALPIISIYILFIMCSTHDLFILLWATYPLFICTKKGER